MQGGVQQAVRPGEARQQPAQWQCGRRGQGPGGAAE